MSTADMARDLVIAAAMPRGAFDDRAAGRQRRRYQQRAPHMGGGT